MIDFREEHGPCYITEIGEYQIPWRALTLQEFLFFREELSAENIPLAVLENEIFKLCVFEKTLVENVQTLSAGIVTTVVQEIYFYSGPEDIEALNRDLYQARNKVNENVLLLYASVIAQVFPGYTIQSCLDLPYPTFMEVFALAELRLIALGMMENYNEPRLESQQENVRRGPRRRTINNENNILNPEPRPIPKPLSINNDESKHFVVDADVNLQNAEIFAGLDPDGKANLALEKHRALQGLDSVFPELMARFRAGETFTPDKINEIKGKTPEEIKANFQQYTKDVLSGKIKVDSPGKLIKPTSSNKKKVTRRIR